MKVGIAASMWRGLVDLPFPEFVTYCRDANCEVMELSGWPQSYSQTLTLDDAGIEQVRTLTRRAGLQVCAVGCPSDFVQPTPEGKSEQTALVKHCVDVAIALGAKVVGLKAGNPTEGMSLDEAQRLMVENIAHAATYARDHGVTLALENGGNVTNDHHRLMQIVNQIADPHVRVLLDVGNFLRYGYSAEGVVGVCQDLAPLSIHIHFKDGRGHKREFKDTALGEGELEMERILQIILDAGYTNPLCAQYEGPDQPAVYKQNVAWIRDHLTR